MVWREAMWNIIGSFFLVFWIPTLLSAPVAVQKKQRHKEGVTVVAHFPQSCFVHEKVPFTITVEHDPSSPILDLEFPSLQEWADIFYYKDKEVLPPDDTSSMERIILSGALHPKQPGTHSIPSLHVQYRSPRRVGLMMFGNMVQGAASQPHVLTVKPLPSDKESNLIGNYSQAEILFAQKKFSQNEAVSLLLHLAGEGNGEWSDVPILRMPDGWKITDSGKWAVKDGYVWEYIVQVDRIGEGEFPAQQVAFFDPQKQRFQKLDIPAQHVQVVQGEDVEEVTDDTEEIRSLIEGMHNNEEMMMVGEREASSLYPSWIRATALPTSLVVGWICCALAIGVARMLQLPFSRQVIWLRRRYAIFTLRKAIQRAQRKEDMIFAYEVLKSYAVQYPIYDKQLAVRYYDLLKELSWYKFSCATLELEVKSKKLLFKKIYVLLNRLSLNT